MLVAIGVISLVQFTACSQEGVAENKTTSQLDIQVDLRKQELSNPSSARLEDMQEMGMRVENMTIQRVFLYLREKPTPSQIKEIESLDILLYLDSWIPPVGDHPTGFLLAEIPIDKLDELADKDFVVRLDTAERVLQPQ